MSRILENTENQITNGFHPQNHVAIDVVKNRNQLANVIAHSVGKVIWVQMGQRNNQGSSGNASYGNAVKIKHNNGYYTLYAHLNRVDVRVGQEVKQGQVIGYMGDSGNAYGAHLHFEVRNEKDVRINPTPYIDSDLPNIVKKEEKPVSNKKSIDEIAKEVIAGKWGNGVDRKNKLTVCGYNYNEVQTKVNEMLNTPSKTSKTVYIVQPRDTLSSIGKKYNTPWQKIYEKNKSVIGNDPNLIKPGQKLEI